MGKTMAEKVNKRVDRLIKIAQKQTAAGKLDQALNTVATCALTLYTSNPRYMEPRLEDCLDALAQQFPVPKDALPPRDSEVLFYDGFGLASRGLVMIYLQALCARRKVTLVTRREWAPNMLEAISLVKSHGGRVCYLKGLQKDRDVRALQRIIAISGAKHLFMYANSDDVVVTTAFLRAGAGRIRYLINLTDHAFWIGSRCADRYIEFRDYGAAISREYRQIPGQKLVKLPFYPRIRENREFQGYPADFDESTQQLVFSGGALYKTVSEDNHYYRMVDMLLYEHPQVVFWYAGAGDGSKLEQLAKQYPGRVWHTPERRDLFAVLRRCTFYLSTYPICGGLMFQFAAAAGKVPVTLKHDDISDDLLMGQKKLGIEFDTPRQANEEMTRLLTNPEYRWQKEARMTRSVLTERSFEKRLTQLLETGDTGLPIDSRLPETEQLQQLYAGNYSQKQMCMDLVRKGNGNLFFRFPFAYARGFLLKGWQKLTHSA